MNSLIVVGLDARHCRDAVGVGDRGESVRAADHRHAAESRGRIGVGLEESGRRDGIQGSIGSSFQNKTFNCRGDGGVDDIEKAGAEGSPVAVCVLASHKKNMTPEVLT